MRFSIQCMRGYWVGVDCGWTRCSLLQLLEHSCGELGGGPNYLRWCLGTVDCGWTRPSERNLATASSIQCTGEVVGSRLRLDASLPWQLLENVFGGLGGGLIGALSDLRACGWTRPPPPPSHRIQWLDFNVVAVTAAGRVTPPGLRLDAADCGWTRLLFGRGGAAAGREPPTCLRGHGRCRSSSPHLSSSSAAPRCFAGAITLPWPLSPSCSIRRVGQRFS